MDCGEFLRIILDKGFIARIIAIVNAFLIVVKFALIEQINIYVHLIKVILSIVSPEGSLRSLLLHYFLPFYKLKFINTY